MKTDTDQTQLYTESLKKLEELFPHETAESILLQLQLAVERITFAGLTQFEGKTDEENLDLCNHLLLGEVSWAMMEFIASLANTQHLHMLEAETGRGFIQFCIDYYRQLPEVNFITAVELPLDFQQTIAEQIAPLHAEHSKIVFQVSPSLVAGFTVKAKQASGDYSLRSYMNHHVRSYVRKKFVSDMEQAAHGKSR